jgi:S-adenosylmethionine synthetase
LARRLEAVRSGRPELRLGPDGKLALLFNSASKALAGFSASVQQAIGGDEIALSRAIRQCVAEELEGSAAAIPGLQLNLPESFHVNGAGNFEVGGPEGDNGLSGKKLVVDAYGPRVPIGGGALSGKDFFKADRAGAVLARKLAKSVVATGLAAECTATLAIFPGDEAFRIVALRDGNGMTLDSSRWARLMDLSLASVGESYALTPTLPALARYGHFTHPIDRGSRCALESEAQARFGPASTVGVGHRTPFSASVRIAENHPLSDRLRTDFQDRLGDLLAFSGVGFLGSACRLPDRNGR